jgi:hypothetical protein
MYTENDPKWVQASEVEWSSPSKTTVNVTAYGETFKNCPLRWNDPTFNKLKSDVLVQNSRGDWLRVWFNDADIVDAK